ncbi:hypothetical protein HDZ31DRAFT_41170, partial [Schizophyllum fasciatum]
KYNEDRYGEEFGANARAWRVLLDEGRVYDATTVKGWRDILDVYLVFTGLFSAVLTTFVVQTSQSLQPDHAEISVALLTELVAIQRAMASGVSVDSIPASDIGVGTVTASVLDYWGNRFWFLSLALSLFAVLMAVLMRQWLEVRFLSRVWQYRYRGMKKWRVPLMVALLPMPLHGSLMMFFIGLFLYILKFDTSMAWVIAALTMFFYSLYILSNILPMVYSQCLYRTPVSHYGYWFVRFVLNWTRRDTSPVPELPAITLVDTADARERSHIAQERAKLTVHGLVWAMSTSSDLSVSSIMMQAASGLPFVWPATEKPYDTLLWDYIIPWFCDTLSSQGVIFAWAPGRERRLERFASCLLLPKDSETSRSTGSDYDDSDMDMESDDGDENHNMGDYHYCVQRILQSLMNAVTSEEVVHSSVPMLAASAIALCNRLPSPGQCLTEHFPHVFLRPSLVGTNEETRTAADRFREMLWPVNPDCPLASSLRLRPVVWYHMLSCITQANFFPSGCCVHIALFLWCNRDPRAPLSSEKDTASSVATLRRLCMMETHYELKQLAQRALHRLVCRCDVDLSESEVREVHRELTSWR